MSALPPAVIWHDLECGSYTADLSLWRELADDAPGPLLDVGAGTGRVALDLAARGHDVVALDADDELLAALHTRARAAGASVEAVRADAREMALGRSFALILVPMQTVQLLGGAPGRAAFLACSREHLSPGGLLAIAIADGREAILDEDGVVPEAPRPDVCELDGVVYTSHPLAVVDEGPAVRIERLREIAAPGGRAVVERDVIRLESLSAATLEQEGRMAGFAVRERRAVPETDEHIGSTVVVLGG